MNWLSWLRPEELADRRHDRLGVDEVVGHGRGHLLVDAHLLLDRALHADEPDAELVLEQLAHAAHPAVAEVVDVVHVLRVAAQLQEEADHRHDVLEVDDLLGERRPQAELGVELEPAHPREVVLLRVQEHPLEEVAGGVEGRRVAGAHPPVDLDQRLLGALDRVLLDRHREHRLDVVALGEEHLERVDLAALGEDHGEHARRERLVALQHHLARPRVHDVGHGVGALEVGLGDLDLLDVEPLDLREVRGGDLLAGVHDLVALAARVLGPEDGLRELEAHEVGGGLPEQPPLAGEDAVRTCRSA